MALNLSTEGLARASSRRPWTTIGIWVLVFVIALVLVVSFLEDGLTTEFNPTNNPESKRGDDLLEERLRSPTGTNEVVIIQSDTFDIDDAEFERFVTDLSGKIAELGPDIIRVDTLANFYQGRNGFLVSEDRHTTIIPFTMAGDFDDASDTIEEVVDGAKGDSDFKVLITGQATVGLDFREVADEGLQKGETFGVPIALLILVVVLGAIVAALIPLIPNPPEDTDGRREESGRGVRELQGK